METDTQTERLVAKLATGNVLATAVLPAESLRRLDALAVANDRSRSAEIRRAVRQYLDGEAEAAA